MVELWMMTSATQLLTEHVLSTHRAGKSHNFRHQKVDNHLQAAFRETKMSATIKKLLIQSKSVISFLNMQNCGLINQDPQKIMVNPHLKCLFHNKF